MIRIRTYPYRIQNNDSSLSALTDGQEMNENIYLRKYSGCRDDNKIDWLPVGKNNYILSQVRTLATIFFINEAVMIKIYIKHKGNVYFNYQKLPARAVRRALPRKTNKRMKNACSLFFAFAIHLFSLSFNNFPARCNWFHTVFGRIPSFASISWLSIPCCFMSKISRWHFGNCLIAS